MQLIIFRVTHAEHKLKVRRYTAGEAMRAQSSRQKTVTRNKR